MDHATRATPGVPTPRRAVRSHPRALPRRLLRAFSDERLVGLLRGGHPEAFEAIYDRYQASILSFCRHMLGSRSEGEDAAQQTFLSAYRHIVESSRPIALRPWLYTVARNCCLSQLRARRDVCGVDEAIAARPDTDGLAEQVQRREDLRALLGDLAALPEQQRAALVLSELGDLPHRDIAGVLGCEPKQVKALVYQARSALMADRKARELDCQSVRERLSVGRRHELLRGELRRHLRSCEGCRQFAAEVKQQRRAIAAVLPVIPTLAFRHGALGPVLGSAAGRGVSPAAGLLGKGLALKAVAVTVAAGVGVGAGVVLSRHHAATPAASHLRARSATLRATVVTPSRPSNKRRAPHARAAPVAPAASGVAAPPAHAKAPTISASPSLVVAPRVSSRGHAPRLGRGHKAHPAPVHVRRSGQPHRSAAHARGPHRSARSGPKAPSSLQHGGRTGVRGPGDGLASPNTVSPGRGH